MSSVSFLSDIGIALVAGVGVFVLIGWALSIAWPLVRNLLLQRGPESHARAVALYASIPIVSAAALFAACIAVTLSAGFDIVPDHCHPGISGTHCIPHAPVSGALLSPAVAISLVVLLVAAFAVSILLRLAGHWRVCRNLLLCAQYDNRLGVYVVDDNRPFAICSGLLRHHIFITTALIAHLDEDELQIVLDHERCHARSSHGVLLFILQVCTATMTQSVRQDLIGTFHLAAEHSCDRFAAKRCGDKLEVASTLLKIRRICSMAKESFSLRNEQLAFSIVGGALGKRVAWLVETQPNFENDLEDVIGHLLCYSIVASVMAAELVHLSLESIFIQLFN